MSILGSLCTATWEPFTSWQPRQSRMVGIAGFVRSAASRSPVVQACTCSLPGPWHFSHCTPSSTWNVGSFSHSSTCAPVAWHPRHIGDSWGSWGMPLSRATSLASGFDRTAYARACFDKSHKLCWWPIVLPRWHDAHTSAPT